MLMPGLVKAILRCRATPHPHPAHQSPAVMGRLTRLQFKTNKDAMNWAAKIPFFYYGAPSAEADHRFSVKSQIIVDAPLMMDQRSRVPWLSAEVWTNVSLSSCSPLTCTPEAMEEVLRRGRVRMGEGQKAGGRGLRMGQGAVLGRGSLKCV
ncbi:hypothetical protein BaRGS_00013008 [Batillaria attramentaria]|uniref:Uncharacterized protein n=1 Tax=Batillaria attramentaria TaxID=370345 RepID=A0ABD0L8G3_9CAEN